MSLDRKMARNGKKKLKSDKASHFMIAHAAMEVAGAAYEELARNDDFYAVHPNQRKWMTENWHQFVPFVRESMVDQLTDDNLSMEQRNEIMEALMLDGAMNPPLAHADAEAKRLSLH